MSAEDPTGLLKCIGLRIAEIRIGKGWSRETCAAEIGVSTRYLAKLEGGHQNMSILKLAHVAEVLEVELRDLLAAPGISEIPVGRPSRR